MMHPQQHDPRSERSAQRGFAGMDKGRQREIARAGGQAAHQRGTAHEFAPEEARLAGKKGGLSISRNRAHMAEIGRLGGLTRGQRLRAKSAANAAGAEAEGMLSQRPCAGPPPTPDA